MPRRILYGFSTDDFALSQVRSLTGAFSCESYRSQVYMLDRLRPQLIT